MSKQAKTRQKVTRPQLSACPNKPKPAEKSRDREPRRVQTSQNPPKSHTVANRREPSRVQTSQNPLKSHTATNQAENQATNQAYETIDIIEGRC